MSTPTTAQTSLTVTWGREHCITYMLGVTNAPAAHDGFGTLTLYDSGEADGPERRRYVLVQQQHETWQESRYRSGIYTYDRTDEMDAASVAHRLYEAMLAGLAAA